VDAKRVTTINGTIDRDHSNPLLIQFTLVVISSLCGGKIIFYSQLNFFYEKTIFGIFGCFIYW
jgi:hypothetical protein